MAQSVKSTTQKFIEIQDVTDDILYFKGGNACLIMEVASVNFYLLSQDEQEARITGFMSFLNSLTFYIQILILSKNIDISTYLSVVEQKIASETRPQISEHLKRYQEFVQSLIKTKNLLDKKFYVVIPYSQLEAGPTIQNNGKSQTDSAKKQTQTMLINKKTSIASQLQRMGLATRQLTSEEIVRLYYEIYNQHNLAIEFNPKDPKNVIV